METALSYITVLPSTKEEVEKFTAKIKEDIENGNIDPLKLVIHLKGLAKVVENINPILTPLFRSEAEKHGKQFSYHGAKFKQMEAGTKYDFSNCGDKEWESANKLKKEREEFLKRLSKPIEIVDEATGEITKYFPPVKTSTSTYSVSL